MGIVQNVIGLVRDINDRKRGAKVEGALKNYFVDPMGTRDAVMQIDPITGIKLGNDIETQQASRATAARKAAEDDMSAIGRYLRGVDPANVGAAIDSAAPLFQSLGISPDRVGRFKEAVSANPTLLTAMDDEAWKNFAKDQYSTTVVPVGALALRGGKRVDRAPFAQKTVTTRGGDGSARTDSFDPNTGQWNTNTADSPAFAVPGAPAVSPGAASPVSKFTGSLTVDSVRPHLMQQESGGNYAAVNKDTGALGAYQVMPATGRALARRLGLAWRPDMMRKDDPASRRYQDAIGGAAIKEAIDASGGDPVTMAMYYHGGSDRSIWGPRTKRYGQELSARLGVGGPVAPSAPEAGGAPVAMPGKPAKRVVTLTPEEIKAEGLPPGSYAQRDETGKLVNIKTPKAADAKNAPTAQIERANGLIETMDRLAGFANDVLAQPGLDTATGVLAGRAPGWLLGQEGQNFINALDNFKRNIGLSELMKFKAMSSQGASGFGNLSNEEGRRLESAYGVLERTSDAGEIRKALNTVLEISSKVKSRQQEFIRQQSGGGEAPMGTIIKMRDGSRMIKTGQGWSPYNG